MIHSTQSGWVGQKVSVDISSNDSTASAEFSFKTKCRNKSKLSTFTSKTTTTSTPPLGSRNKIFVLLPRDWDVFFIVVVLLQSVVKATIYCWLSGHLSHFLNAVQKGPGFRSRQRFLTTFHQRRSILGFYTYQRLENSDPKDLTPFYYYPAVLIEHC